MSSDMSSGKTGTLRLFAGVAYQPSPAVLSLLEHLRQQASDPSTKLRVTDETDLHITMKFMGPVNSGQIPAIVDTLEQAFARQDAFTVQLTGMGCFSSSLWLGVQRHQALDELACRTEQCLQGLGFPPEHRPFKPHITVARLGRNARFKVSRLLEETTDTFWGELPISAVSLYESKTLPQGARYNVLHSVKLQPPAA